MCLYAYRSVDNIIYIQAHFTCFLLEYKYTHKIRHTHTSGTQTHVLCMGVSAWAYRIVGNFHEVKISCFRDLIQFTKVYLQNRSNANYRKMFECEITKYSLQNFQYHSYDINTVPVWVCL